MGSPISTSPSPAQGAGMCHSPHTTPGAAAELGTGIDPGLPFCALFTRSSNVIQLFHLLTEPLLIITSVSFPRESFSLSGSCSVTGSPKCLWKRWTEQGTITGPWHRMGLPCTWVNVLPITPHPLWSEISGEWTYFLFKPQHVTGFKQLLCSSVHAAHVTLTTRGKNRLF